MLVTFGLAYCADTDRLVSVESRLTYTQNTHKIPDALWFHEFSFSVIVVSLGGDSPTFETQDRTSARAYIPEGCRHLVMPIVSASLRALVNRVRPSVIYRVTKSRNPTSKALQKHVLLTDSLNDEGYRIIESGTDGWGRSFWLLKR